MCDCEDDWWDSLSPKEQKKILKEHEKTRKEHIKKTRKMLKTLYTMSKTGIPNYTWEADGTSYTFTFSVYADDYKALSEAPGKEVYEYSI